MLSRDQPNPGRQVASGREGCPIAHLGDQSGGHNWANAGYLLEPPALFTRSVPGMDALLNGYDLCRDGFILTRKNSETEPCDCWNSIIISVANDLDQLGSALAALGRDDAQLRHVATDRVRQHRTLANQKLPAAM